MRNLDIHRKPKFVQPAPQIAPAAAPASSSASAPAALRPTPVSAPAEQKKAPEPIGRTRRKFIFKKSLVLVPFTVLVLISGTVIGTRFINLASSVSVGNTTVSANINNVADGIAAMLSNLVPAFKPLDQSNVQGAIRGKQQLNVLLLGYGGDGHQGSYLTDTLIVLHLDFATDQAALISIPRDTWVQIPTSGSNGGFWKINAAYAIGLDDRGYPNKLPEFSGAAGAGNLAKAEASKIIGMPVDYFVALDFSGFQKIVDDLGGVDVNVDTAFTDYSYPESDQNIDGAWCTETVAPSDCRFKVVHFDSGPQHMDGQRALEYARSRHAAGAEGSDFARGRRQQKLLAAIEQKALTLGEVSKWPQLASDVQGHFRTDLGFAEIADLSNYVSQIDLSNATKISIDDNGLLQSGQSDDGQYILTPTAGQQDYSKIQEYVYDKINGISTGQTNTNTNEKSASFANPKTPVQN